MDTESDISDDSSAQIETGSTAKEAGKIAAHSKKRIRRREGQVWTHIKKKRRFNLFNRRPRSPNLAPPCELDGQKDETSLQESPSDDSEQGEPLHGESSPARNSSLSAKGILTVTLLDGKDLPAMDDNGFSDPYCKFRLGSHKYKSKVKAKTLNPQWKEKFDFRVFEGDDTLSIEVWDRNFTSSNNYIGSCKVDLGSLVPDKTYDLTLPLVDSGCGSVHLLLCLSGIAMNQVDECDGPQNDVTEESYGWISLLKLKPVRDVGCLKAKIGGVSELSTGGNVSLFAILRVGNSEFRTKVIPMCTSPVWNKTFYFNIKDIHDDLEVSVYNERKAGKNELMGKVIIPLLRLGVNTAKSYALKDKRCIVKAKAGGVVDLECDLVYNPIRAGIRTFLPKEVRMMEEEETFKTKVLISNIRRATDVGSTLQSVGNFIESLWAWEDGWLSALTFLFFTVTCLLAELWMVFPFLILLLLYGYLVVYLRGHHLWQTDRGRKSGHKDEDDEEESSMEELEGSDLEDEGEPTAEDQSKAGISQKFKQLQRVLLFLQTLLGQLADLGERVHNFCHWRVPWLCWLAITVLTVAMVIVYFVPLRYIILAWGVNKFTKRLRNPHFIDNQELLDFISRAPTNGQLHQWSEIPVQATEPLTQISSSNNRTPGHSLQYQKRTDFRLTFYLILFLVIPVASATTIGAMTSMVPHPLYTSIASYTRQDTPT